MKRIGEAIAAFVAGIVSGLVVIMASEWLALAFVAPLAGLKFCIWYLLA